MTVSPAWRGPRWREEDRCGWVTRETRGRCLAHAEHQPHAAATRRYVAPSRRGARCFRPRGNGCVIWRIWPSGSGLCFLAHLLKLSSQRSENQDLTGQQNRAGARSAALAGPALPAGAADRRSSAARVTPAWAGCESTRGQQTPWDTLGHPGPEAVPGEKAALGELWPSKVVWLGRSGGTAARPSLLFWGARKGPDRCCPLSPPARRPAPS